MTADKPSTALMVAPPSGALAMMGTPSEAEERLRELQDFIKRAMVEGSDYGKIPGTDKDTLLQPGAQKLAEIYGFAVDFEDARPPIERWGDDGSEPLFAYFKRARLMRRTDGLFVGAGIGSCNSREEKYSGRWVFEREVPDHLDRSRLRRRDGKSKKNGSPYVMFRIPNPALFDLVNTIEKMAAKRALVMAVIAATRSAGIFTQDLEDMAPEARGAKGKPEASEAEYEEDGGTAPPPKPPVSSDVLAARARWSDPAEKWTPDSTAAVLRVLGASHDANDRAMVWEWRIDSADAAGLDAIVSALAAEQHPGLRADMLRRVEERRAEMGKPGNGGGT